MSTDQLLTPTEAAKLKKMNLNQFLYYVKAGRAPKPVRIGVHNHCFYKQADIEAWEPVKFKTGKKNS